MDLNQKKITFKIFLDDIQLDQEIEAWIINFQIDVVAPLV